MKPNAVTPHFQALVEQELLSGETLKWVGQPQPFRMARQHLVTSLFSIVWLGMVIFMYTQLTGNMLRPRSFGGMSSGFSSFASIFQLVLALFFVIGLGMLFSPLINAFLAMQTVYAITNRRMLTVKEYGISALNLVFNRSVISYGEKDIQRVERRDYGGDVGDVIIGYETRTRRSRSSSGMYRTSTYTVPIGLLGVHNVREVEALVLETFLRDDDAVPDKPKKPAAPLPAAAPDEPNDTPPKVNPSRGKGGDFEDWRER
jgi:hypothetical protein